MDSKEVEGLHWWKEERDRAPMNASGFLRGSLDKGIFGLGGDVGELRRNVGNSIVGDNGSLPPNMPLWQANYFKAENKEGRPIKKPQL